MILCYMMIWTLAKPLIEPIIFLDSAVFTVEPACYCSNSNKIHLQELESFFFIKDFGVFSKGR